ncbi:MAG: 50S ribosomal protein L4 [Alphaproteobacteria bacterium]
MGDVVTIDVKTLDGDAAGSVDLDATIYGLDPRKDILHRVVLWQLDRRRQGTHKTKTRREVTGTTKKFVRQKGSGGARHGNRKVPQFRGGGKAHGPVLREHGHDLTKKMRRLGLKHALSAKCKASELLVLDAATLDEPKTKTLEAKLASLNVTSALVVDGAVVDENFRRAAGNLPLIDVLPVQGINVRDILRRDVLVLTRAALNHLEARLK